MARDIAPTVKITEPGRTPLHLVIRHPVEIGRDCDGLLLADPELSRRHLRVRATGGRVTVQDLGSTNGTVLDGTPLLGPAVVEAGQVVGFGRCRLEVVPVDATTTSRELERSDPLRPSSIDIVAAAAAADPARLSAKLGRSGTVTIVLSDVERSTHDHELGDEAWVRRLRFHNSLVRRQVERTGGTEIESRDDGFMLAFPSARAALSCSIEIMRAFETHARSRPPDALRVRIGIHAGEAIVDEHDLVAMPVALAARLGNQARAGEILVSSLVREIVESRGDVTFVTPPRVDLEELGVGPSFHRVDWTKPGG